MEKGTRKTAIGSEGLLFEIGREIPCATSFARKFDEAFKRFARCLVLMSYEETRCFGVREGRYPVAALKLLDSTQMKVFTYCKALRHRYCSHGEF